MILVFLKHLCLGAFQDIQGKRSTSWFHNMLAVKTMDYLTLGMSKLWSLPVTTTPKGNACFEMALEAHT